MIQKELPQNQFDNVIRWIKNEKEERLQQLDGAIAKHAGRLRVRLNPSLAVKGIPSGSDQFDSGSIVEWLEKIKKSDTVAKQQVAILLATIRVRMGG